MNVSPSTYIIGIIMFTFFILGGMAIMNEFQLKDPTFVDTVKYSQFNSTFNKMNDVTKQTTSLEEGITKSKNDYGVFGVLNSLISTAWNTLTLLFSSFSFMDGVFMGLSSFFGIPGWIPAIIIMLISVMLVFAIFSAIFQKPDL